MKKQLLWVFALLLTMFIPTQKAFADVPVASTAENPVWYQVYLGIWGGPEERAGRYLSVDGSGNVVTIAASEASDADANLWRLDGTDLTSVKFISKTGKELSHPATVGAGAQVTLAEIGSAALPYWNITDFTGSLDGYYIVALGDGVAANAALNAGGSYTNYNESLPWAVGLYDNVTGNASAWNFKQVAVAEPEPTTYAVSVSVNDAAMGSATISADSVEENATVTLTATANEGYEFVNWTVDGSEVSTEATYEATVTAETAYVANFQAVAVEPEAEYCTTFGTSTRTGGDRKLNSMSFACGANTATIAVNQSASYGATVYFDKTTEVLNATAGAEVTSTIDWTGSWAHGYLYVDYDGDKTFNQTVNANGTTGGELVSYTCYGDDDNGFYNSKGESVGAGDGILATNMPAFTLPADLAPGTYRARYKVDWNYLDPCEPNPGQGDAGYANAPAVVDFTINVVYVDPSTTYAVSVSVNDETMGSATISADEVAANGTVTLTATATEGYEFVNWTVAGVEVSTENPYEATVTAETAYVANFQAVSEEPGSDVVEEKLTPASANASIGHYESNSVSKIIDGSYTSKYWSNGPQTVGSTVGVELSEATTIGTVKIYFASGDQPVAADIQVSTDNSQWKTISSFVTADIVADGGNYVYSCNALGEAAKYVRMYITTQTGNWLQVVEFEVYEVAANIPARTISVSVNNAEMGNAYVNEEGTAEVTGATGLVKLVATANEGYKFVGWTVGNDTISTAATYIDKTEGDKAYVANFAALELFNVTVSVNDAAMGSAVADPAEVLEGSQTTLTATPAEGYRFNKWTLNGEDVSTEATITVTINSDVEYVANFMSAPVAVEAVDAPSHYSSYVASNIIDGIYSTYYDSESTLNPGECITLTLAEETVIEKIKYFVSSTYFRPGKAKFQVSVDGENWEDVPNSEFEGDALPRDSKTNCYLFDLDVDNVTAKYVRMYIIEKKSYVDANEIEIYAANIELPARTISVAVNDEAMGTAYVNEEGTTSLADQTGIVRLVATPNEGYTFVNWTLDGEEVSTSTSYTDKTEGDKTYVANFRALQLFDVSVSVNKTTMGSATISATQALEGSEVTLTATPNEGYEIYTWTVNDSIVSRDLTFTTEVYASAEYVANFRPIPTKIDVETIETSMSPYYGSVITNLIDGNYDTYFMSSSSVGATITITLPEETVLGDVKFYLYSLNYVPALAKLQVSLDKENWEDVEGAIIESTAGAKEDPASGRNCITLDGKSTPAKYVRLYIEQTPTYSSFAMYEIGVYEGIIEVDPRTVSVAVNDEAMGVAYIGTEGTTTVENETGAVRVAAVPNEGYTFVNWTLDGDTISTSATYMDKTEGDKTYVANFRALEIYQVAVSSADDTKVTVEATETGDVYEGTEITLTATGVGLYVFDTWTVNGVPVSSDNPYTVTVLESAEYVATYKEKEYCTYPGNMGSSRRLNSFTISDGAEASVTVTDIQPETNSPVYVDKISSVLTVAPGATLSFSELDWQGEWMHGYVFIDYDNDREFNSTINADGTTGGELVSFSYYDGYNSLGATAQNNGGVNVNSMPAWTLPADLAEGTYRLRFNVAWSSIEACGYGNMASEGGCMCDITLQVKLPAFVVTVSSADEEMGSAYIGAEGTTEAEFTREGTETATITAVPATGYEFVNWTLNGEEVSTEAEYTTTLVTENRDYVANFQFILLDPREVTVVSANEAKGSVAIISPEAEGTTVTTGDIVIVEATPASDDDLFVNWTIDGVEVSTDATYKYKAAEAVTIQANFRSEYQVIVEAAEDGSLSVSYNGSAIASGTRVPEGAEITIAAAADYAKFLNSISVNGEAIFDGPQVTTYETTVTVEGETTISAEFGDPQLFLTYEYSGNGYIEVWNDENAEDTQFAYGDEVPYNSDLYVFIYPMGDDEVVSITVNGETEGLSGSYMDEYAEYASILVAPQESVHVIVEFTGESTGIESVEGDVAEVYSANGTIYVNGYEGTAQVINLAGALVKEVAVSGNEQIKIAQGIYFVVTGSQVTKVVVK